MQHGAKLPHSIVVIIPEEMNLQPGRSTLKMSLNSSTAKITRALFAWNMAKALMAKKAKPALLKLTGKVILLRFSFLSLINIPVEDSPSSKKGALHKKGKKKMALAKSLSRKGKRIDTNGNGFSPYCRKIIYYFSLCGLTLCVPIAIWMASLRETNRAI